MAALIVCAVYLVSWVFALVFARWKEVTLRDPRRAAEAEVSQTEAEWREKWLKDANGQQAARLQAAMTCDASVETDSSKMGFSEHVADASDINHEPQLIEQPQVYETPQVFESSRETEQPQAAEHPQATLRPPQSAGPLAEQSPPPMPVASECEPVRLKAVSLTERDANEEIAELPMPYSRREANAISVGRPETREMISDSVDNFLSRGYIKCICCQVDAPGGTVQQVSLGDCPRIIVSTSPRR